MKSKYMEALTQSIDEFWMIHHFPPTIRDLAESTANANGGKVASTSVINYVLNGIPDIRRAANGRIIPKWVDNLFEEGDK
jgi:hypothetical protein